MVDELLAESLPGSLREVIVDARGGQSLLRRGAHRNAHRPRRARAPQRRVVREPAADRVRDPRHRAGRRRGAARSPPRGREGRAAGGRGRRPDLLGRPRRRAPRPGGARLPAARDAGLHPPPLRLDAGGRARVRVQARGDARGRVREPAEGAPRAAARRLRGVARSGSEAARDEHAPLLAHHYAQAVRAEDADLAWGDEPAERERLQRLAATWLRRAGELAVSRYDLDEGIASAATGGRARDRRDDAGGALARDRTCERTRIPGRRFLGGDGALARAHQRPLDTRRDVRRARLPDVVPRRDVDPRSGPRPRLVVDREGDRADRAGNSGAREGAQRARLLGRESRSGGRARGERDGRRARRPGSPRGGSVRPLPRRLPVGAIRRGARMGTAAAGLHRPAERPRTGRRGIRGDRSRST